MRKKHPKDYIGFGDDCPEKDELMALLLEKYFPGMRIKSAVRDAVVWGTDIYNIRRVLPVLRDHVDEIKARAEQNYANWEGRFKIKVNRVHEVILLGLEYLERGKV